MKGLLCSVVSVTTVVLVASAGMASGQNLFKEAEDAMARSRWVTVRQLPAIEIALEANDTLLIESIDHLPRRLAMRIDGKAIAADCRLTQSKDNTYSYEMRKNELDEERGGSASTMNVSTTTYHASCKFPEGTTARAAKAQSITVQVAIPEGLTQPYDLTAKQLKRFQKLGK